MSVCFIILIFISEYAAATKPRYLEASSRNSGLASGSELGDVKTNFTGDNCQLRRSTSVRYCGVFSSLMISYTALNYIELNVRLPITEEDCEKLPVSEFSKEYMVHGETNGHGDCSSHPFKFNGKFYQNHALFQKLEVRKSSQKTVDEFFSPQTIDDILRKYLSENGTLPVTPTTSSTDSYSMYYLFTGIIPLVLMVVVVVIRKKFSKNTENNNDLQHVLMK